MSKNARLEAIEPSEAKRLWLESHIDEWAEATMELQRYQIEVFIDWLDEQDIGDMRDVSGRIVHKFRLDSKDGLAQSTVSARIGTVRRFLSFCASIDGVDPSVPERIETPNRGDIVRTEALGKQQAEAALSYLRKYAYASREHALLALTWHTGIRTGTLVSLDVEDIEADKHRLRIRHRPESGTPLKNGKRAERYIALSPDITEILEDYITNQRSSLPTNDDNRQPLFVTSKGRASGKTLRQWFYKSTRPCLYGDCPHGRSPSDCDAAQRQRDAKDCPSSLSGHPIRRGAITQFLKDDTPRKAVSDRCNVSNDILDKHYDARSESEKAENRRKFFG